MSNKFKKFDDAFTHAELVSILNGFNSQSAYSVTKRNNKVEFDKLLLLIPEGYSNNRLNDIESIDLVYSGSKSEPILLTIAVGRNDRHRGKECYDIDVFNVCPNNENTESYFRQQWLHWKNEFGKRVSFEVAPSKIIDENERKDSTYSTFLTGSVSFDDFNKYAEEKPDFYDIHSGSFSELRRLL